MKKYYLVLFLFLYSLIIKSFANANSLTLESPTFATNTTIPIQYTCDGKNDSPPLSWEDSTSNTQSYTLIVIDPDAPGGTWTHWILFNIPSNLKQLPERTTTPLDATSGKNSWGETGYRGPCPPTGTHRYLFKLYALDTKLNLDETATQQDIMQAMQNHILATSELIGLYR